MSKPEDEIFINLFRDKPNENFNKLAVKCNIDYYLACGIVGYYAHHLYDFLVSQKIIEVPGTERIKVFALEREKALEQLAKDKYWYTEEGYSYQLEQIMSDQSQKVKNASKVTILTEIMKTNPIDLKKVLELL